VRTRRAGAIVLGLLAFAMALLSCGGGGGLYGKFTTEYPFVLYWSVAAADVNGDGLSDLVISYSYDNGQKQGFVAVYLQDPARHGAFLSPTKYKVGLSPVAVAVSDLNGDNKPDIVVVNDSDPTSNASNNSISVLLQDPASPGKFLPGVTYPTGTGPVQVSIGDLNNDGRPDIAVADEAGVSLFFQNSETPGTFSTRTTVNSGSPTIAVTIADLNEDGRGDLITSSNFGLQVWLQDPATAGRFLTPATYVAGAVPTFIVAADLNKDGKPDLAVANAGSLMDGSDASVSVLLQNAATPGTFLAPQNYATGRHSEVVGVADLNGDGNLDLAVANWAGVGGGDGTVSVLLHDAAQPGRFLPATNYGESAGIGSWVALADLNQDDRIDLVFSDSMTVTVRFQDASKPGTFLNRTIVAQ
jgi:FG-GAP-like repeat